MTHSECASTSRAARAFRDGCGSAVRIAHGRGIHTGYCRVRDRPRVAVRDAVPGGRQTDCTGSAEASTEDRPHDMCYNGGFTLDYQPFMRDRGVAL